jgi:hypothetical protein
MVTLTILLVLVTTIILVILFIAIWRLNRRNTVITLDRSEIEWTQLECPMCHKKLTTGFALPGRGVIWSDKSEKKPGPFANIGSVLDNTISISFRPALNIAWRCKGCELVILDISKMINTNDA